MHRERSEAPSNMADDPLEAVMRIGRLTNTEKAIFAYLADNANVRVARKDLLPILKGRASHTIDSHIMAIRRKLEKSGLQVTITTIIGYGFILNVETYPRGATG